MRQPIVGVLALQGDVREHQLALSSVGAASPKVYRADQLRAVDGLVIPGGESTTISMLAVRAGLMEPLREAVAAGLPVYGSCAGMILLADKLLDGRADQQTIGGIDMVVRRNAFGRQVDSFECDVPFAGVTGSPVRAVFIRAPWVESVGPGVEVLARVPGPGSRRGARSGSAAPEGDRPQGDRPQGDRPQGDRPQGDRPQGDRIVAVRVGNLLATSFHPELTGDHRVHGLFVDIVREASSAQPRRQTSDNL